MKHKYGSLQLVCLVGWIFDYKLKYSLLKKIKIKINYIFLSYNNCITYEIIIVIYHEYINYILLMYCI